MKKLYLLLIITFFLFQKSKAQDTLLYENFNVDPTATWLTINNGNDLVWVSLDADGYADGHPTQLPLNWFWEPGAFSFIDTTGCIASSSWLNPAGAAANYMMTPPVHISDASATLNWKSAPYQTPLYLDGYRVLISTTDNTETSFTDTVFVAAEYVSRTVASPNFSFYTFDPPGAFVHGMDGTYTQADTTATPVDSTRLFGVMRPFSVSLAPYVGMDIYIAWLHDSFDDNIIGVDDILVTENSATGIRKNTETGKLSIYPNPASDKFEMEYNLPVSSMITLNIYDMKGSLVKQEIKGMQLAGNQKLTSNVQDLKAGNYTVRLIAGDKYIQNNIVISR